MNTALLRSLLVSAGALVWTGAGADEPADFEACLEAEPGPMPEDERQRITLSLLERYPELASSPGVKAAYDSPSCPGVTSGTSVIYYPHTDNHGFKEAFEAHCSRTYPETTWTCDDVVIRRYLRLASQDFEVRLKGEITSEAALALIEASRRDLQAVTEADGRPDTAIIVLPHDTSLRVTPVTAPDGSRGISVERVEQSGEDVVAYKVTWGTPEGYSRLTMLATLTEGGDPAYPDDWHASLFNSPTQE